MSKLSKRQQVEKACRMLLGSINIEDGTRPGLVDTPRRFGVAWEEWTNGYDIDPKSVLREFEDGAERYDQMIVQRDIPVYSHCEHHLAPIFGSAIIAYVPDGRIVGLSKLFRLVEVFARRLQVQERMTQQIAGALHEYLKPKGCGVIIHARHLCMESRGINRAGIITTTSALEGVFRDAEVRGEFLSLSR